ncbi:hypothetical protein TIFTF001_021875 [Ficus carica]|uniref:Uncharacterized protein n=1 Tax=Ficus carica TaxID=3494 RepID=A0AA88AZ53_FICCA|nr:hypothetical protein TIFTF001_021875 [Ficus carica]
MNDTESPPLARLVSLPAGQTSLHTTATVSDPILGNTVIVDSLTTQETPSVQKNSYAVILQNLNDSSPDLSTSAALVKKRRFCFNSHHIRECVSKMWQEGRNGSSAQVQQTKNQQRDKQIMEENVQSADTQKPTSEQESHDKDKEKERTVDVNEKKKMENTPTPAKSPMVSSSSNGSSSSSGQQRHSTPVSTPFFNMPNITDLSIRNIAIDLPFSLLNKSVSAGVEEVNKVTTVSWADQAENEEQ